MSERARERRRALVFYSMSFFLTSYFWNCLEHILICFQFYVGLHEQQRKKPNSLPQSRSVYLVSLPAILIWKWKTCWKTKQITSWFILCSSKWKGISGKCSLYTISTRTTAFLSAGHELPWCVCLCVWCVLCVFFLLKNSVHFKWI